MSAGLALPGIADACDVRVAVQRVCTAVEGCKVGSVQLGERWVHYRGRFSYILLYYYYIYNIYIHMIFTDFK